MKQVLVCLCLVAAGADVDVGYDAKTKIRSAQNAAMAWLARQNAHASSTRVYSDSDPTAVAAKGPLDYERWPQNLAPAAAAAKASTRPVRSRLGGLDYGVSAEMCAPLVHTDTCYQEPECFDVPDVPAGEFGFLAGGNPISVACPVEGIDCFGDTCDSYTEFLREYEECQAQCASCCAKNNTKWAQTAPRACKTCGYNDDADAVSTPFDCQTCEGETEILVVFADCTGMCLDAAGADYYKDKYSVAGLAESACLANVNCYTGADKTFIESLPTDGTNTNFPGEDGSYSYSYSYGIDDLIADCWDGNGMDDCFSKEIDAGVVTQEEVIEARENWDIPEPTEDADGPTCEDFQEWSWFGALCANPFPVPEGSTEAICTPEFDATMECVMEGILLDSGLACTELSCAATAGTTPAPSGSGPPPGTSPPATTPPATSPAPTSAEATSSAPSAALSAAPAPAPTATPMAAPSTTPPATKPPSTEPPATTPPATTPPATTPTAMPTSPADEPTPKPTKNKKSDGAAALGGPAVAAIAAAVAIALV